jgi:hypothetical protein
VRTRPVTGCEANRSDLQPAGLLERDPSKSRRLVPRRAEIAARARGIRGSGLRRIPRNSQKRGAGAGSDCHRLFLRPVDPSIAREWKCVAISAAKNAVRFAIGELSGCDAIERESSLVRYYVIHRARRVNCALSVRTLRFSA